MEKSKILDRIINEKTRLEVRALSTDMRKPLNLDAVLIDYDNEGFLYKGKESKDSPESAYYIPKNAVAFMKFPTHTNENLQENTPIKTIEQPIEGCYSFLDATYNPQTRELRRGDKKEFMKGDKYHLALSLLFESEPEDPVPIESFIETSGNEELNKKQKHAMTASMTRLRGILERFNLTIYAIPNKGYTLREKQ